ncbi:MAG TPA: hypothetical protein VHE35_19530 [Kofleriaceae bacterium]|nr:hypothetical protein [Kofleriaceae bacterium]
MTIARALPLLLLAACVPTQPAPGDPDGGPADTDAAVDARPDAPVDAAIDAGPRPIDLGVSWTPVGYPVPTAADRAAFYTGHAAYGTQISVHRPWRQDRASAGLPDPFVAPIAAESAQYGFELMYGYGFDVDDAAGGSDLTSVDEPANDTWTNAATRRDFCAVGVDFARAHHPRYMFLGNETDAYYRDHHDDWPNWVSELHACRDAIHAVSPSTLVFTTFQLEFTKGAAQKTGRPLVPADWQPIADVAGAVDGIGFTSYPYFEYETPADLPATYYREIADHTDLPILFTELGWVADPSQPYTGSEAEQAAFVDRFFELTAGLDVRYAVWLAENDWPPAILGPGSAFHEIGLRDATGAPRPADAAWRAHVPR